MCGFLGTRWIEVSKQLVGRSENACKNRWNSAARRRANASQRGGGADGSPSLSTPEWSDQFESPADASASWVPLAWSDNGTPGSGLKRAPGSSGRKRGSSSKRPSPSTAPVAAPPPATIPSIAEDDDDDDDDDNTVVRDFIEDDDAEASEPVPVVVQSMRSGVTRSTSRRVEFPPPPMPHRLSKPSGVAGESPEMKDVMRRLKGPAYSPSFPASPVASLLCLSGPAAVSN